MVQVGHRPPEAAESSAVSTHQTRSRAAVKAGRGQDGIFRPVFSAQLPTVYHLAGQRGAGARALCRGGKMLINRELLVLGLPPPRE